jgi:hypothetical protein
MLGLVQRMMSAGMAMARRVNRIARHRLAGGDPARLAPAGCNPTLANALVVQAVSWTAALRARLSGAAAEPAMVPGLPRLEPIPHTPGRAAEPRADAPAAPMEAQAGAAEDDWHDWRALARPWRMGPGGVAVAARAIAGLSDREVVARICGNLRRAAAELGAEAEIGRIAALEGAARLLCPEAADDPDSGGGDCGGGGPAGGDPNRDDPGGAGGAPDGPVTGAGPDPPSPLPHR